MRFKKLKKAQAWGFDLMIATIIFTAAILTFYLYTLNIPTETQEIIDSLALDSNIITSIVLSDGFPSDWNSTNVIAPGILTNNQINQTKLEKFHTLTLTDYQKTKSMFNTKYDYLFTFEDTNGIVNYLAGCGAGNQQPLVIKNRLAYYYQNEDEMLNEMQELNADIYSSGGGNNLDTLLNNINNYNIILAEDANINQQAKINQLENYVLNGGKFIFSQNIGGGTQAFGLSQSGGQQTNPATVIAPDILLQLTNNTQYSLDQRPTMINDLNNLNVANYIEIAKYQNNKAAISKWNYDSGLVYYFSDFEVESGANFQNEVKNLTSALNYDNCIVNMSNINSKNLIKETRITNYRNKPVTLNLYIWEV